MRIQEGIIVPAQDQQYQNFIVRYNQNLHGDFDYESDDTFQIVNDLFGILYVPEQDVPALEFNSYSYSSIPKCYTYMDLGALSASGVLRLHDHPYLRLKGAGTLVAVIDSGIDYQHPAFRNGDQSKILSIWDQSLPGGRSGRIFEQATGTSLAAAQAAGIAALLFEWALIRGNEPYFTGNSVKNYLSRGAVRDDIIQYPNPNWGYGRVDLYHTFELLT